MENYIGLIVSYVFVFLMIGISTALQKKGVFNDEGARKFIHIGVSNWWIILMIFFDHVFLASIAPISFIILNYASYKLNIIKAMERSGKGNLGTVYFPISLLILVLFSFATGYLYIGGLGILILGYGDGFAAVIGKAYGRRQLAFNKTLEGSLTMFFASLVVAITLLLMYVPAHAIWFAPLIALFATCVELVTPKGLDNLSVPLATSLFSYVILLTIGVL